jgi:hypothetical protein
MEDEPFRAVVSDWEDALLAINGGRLSAEGGDMLFHPSALKPGNYELSTNAFSSSVDLVFLLLPALSALPYRTSLSVSGVTHAAMSLCTDTVRETVLGFLERMGFYASFSLKRFGFYGTGGGSVEARVYPAERKALDGAGASLLHGGGTSWIPSGARVYISGLPTAAAASQKKQIVEALGIPADSAGIMEVMDSDGSGNFVQVYFRPAETLPFGGGNVVLSRIFDMVDCRGGYIYNDENTGRSLAEFIGGCADFRESGDIPGNIIEEIAPYLLLSGSECPGNGTFRLLKEFL